MFLVHQEKYIDIDKIESFVAHPNRDRHLYITMDSGITHKLYFENQNELLQVITKIQDSRDKK
ncbi:hypothetical protein [Acinetobacter gerneri]|jgi:hypothetical protein|uniref:Uncharacterized protein n=2 Tax=Acinetobacter gerneri TaxID=202952 RepID=N8ZUL1_9GAMM|nr:hypothetical protein [Acinetobacter gerneri]ENV35155.1 hypothetical protein F960_00453 [Acinetobacter gerneri DSM 14967 = CIP 107464 = MTCC 9824]EPR83397.1 hypothetical protein L289_2136 [Acinetobacter gerneri DSM 14967 = CIP 107464 = MTCC 9824]MCH4243907.1 hypothetical protein [Acinetobacter gerneri]MDQ9008780.1 hypothetical protein [Acinetobacter gerneri]MDQ9012884.1 hypothetical protein [Acinetobacter gerneri]